MNVQFDDLDAGPPVGCRFAGKSLPICPRRQWGGILLGRCPSVVLVLNCRPCQELHQWTCKSKGEARSGAGAFKMEESSFPWPGREPFNRFVGSRWDINLQPVDHNVIANSLLSPFHSTSCLPSTWTKPMIPLLMCGSPARIRDVFWTFITSSGQIAIPVTWVFGTMTLWVMSDSSDIVSGHQDITKWS